MTFLRRVREAGRAGDWLLLGAGFDLARFDHRAVRNDRHSRVEMHLVSRVPQQVVIPGAGIVASFAEGESIWTESSCKYTTAGVASLGAAAGFAVREQWVDTDTGFALSLFQSDQAEAGRGVRD